MFMHMRDSSIFVYLAASKCYLSRDYNTDAVFLHPTLNPDTRVKPGHESYKTREKKTFREEHTVRFGGEWIVESKPGHALLRS